MFFTESDLRFIKEQIMILKT